MDRAETIKLEQSLTVTALNSFERDENGNILPPCQHSAIAYELQERLRAQALTRDDLEALVIGQTVCLAGCLFEQPEPDEAVAVLYEGRRYG